jgi:D-proline reductase (dithiol) PrdB
MPEVKSDPRWIAGFREQYGPWWAQAAPLIERHEYGAAFSHYPWPTFAEAPWTPLAKPLRGCRLAVLTTGGLFRPGVDSPFDERGGEGDWSWRAIPADVPIQSLAIAHPHFPHEAARADMNTIFPLDRLRDLQAEGVVGDLAPTHYSLMGYCTRAADLAETTAPEIARRMTADGVDAALLVPV